MSYVGKVKKGSTLHLVGSTLYGTCATAAGTAAKVVTCADFDALFTGVTIHVKMTNANTVASPTLNVNGTGAKGIRFISGEARGYWLAGEVVSFTYDGTYWLMNDAGIANYNLDAVYTTVNVPHNNNTEVNLGVTIPQDGLCIAQCQVSFVSNATGMRYASPLKRNADGTDSASILGASSQAPASGQWRASIPFVSTVKAGNYFVMRLYQLSGTTLSATVSMYAKILLHDRQIFST